MTGQPLHAAAIFVALLVLLLVGLGVNVSLMRMRKKVRLGDGGDKTLARAIRMHGNAAEHVPLLLVLLVVLAGLGAPAAAVTALGAACLGARLVHATGMFTKVFLASASGATLTYVLEAGMSGYVLWLLAARAG